MANTPIRKRSYVVLMSREEIKRLTGIDILQTMEENSMNPNAFTPTPAFRKGQRVRIVNGGAHHGWYGVVTDISTITVVVEFENHSSHEFGSFFPTSLVDAARAFKVGQRVKVIRGWYDGDYAVVEGFDNLAQTRPVAFIKFERSGHSSAMYVDALVDATVIFEVVDERQKLRDAWHAAANERKEQSKAVDHQKRRVIDAEGVLAQRRSDLRAAELRFDKLKERSRAAAVKLDEYDAETTRRKAREFAATASKAAESTFPQKLDALGLGAVIKSHANRYVKAPNGKWVGPSGGAHDSTAFGSWFVTIISEGVK